MALSKLQPFSWQPWTILENHFKAREITVGTCARHSCPPSSPYSLDLLFIRDLQNVCQWFPMMHWCPSSVTAMDRSKKTLTRPPLTSQKRSRANVWGAPGPPIPFRKFRWQWIARCVDLSFATKAICWWWSFHASSFDFSCCYIIYWSFMLRRCQKTILRLARAPISDLVNLDHVADLLQRPDGGVGQVLPQTLSKLVWLMKFFLVL